MEMQDRVNVRDAISTLCSGGGLLSGVALSCVKTGIQVFGRSLDSKVQMMEGVDIHLVSISSIKRLEPFQAGLWYFWSVSYGCYIEGTSSRACLRFPRLRSRKRQSLFGEGITL